MNELMSLQTLTQSAMEETCQYSRPGKMRCRQTRHCLSFGKAQGESVESEDRVANAVLMRLWWR